LFWPQSFDLIFRRIFYEKVQIKKGASATYDKRFGFAPIFAHASALGGGLDGQRATSTRFEPLQL
jgi:hypothetical protein